MLYVAQQSMYYGIIHLCTVCIQLECMHNIMFPDSLWNEKINKNDEKNRVVLFDFVFMSLAFMQSLYFSFIFLCFLRFHDLHICICIIAFMYMQYDGGIYLWWFEVVFSPAYLPPFILFFGYSCLLRIPFFLPLLSSELVQLVVLCENLKLIHTLIRFLINYRIWMSFHHMRAASYYDNEVQWQKGNVKAVGNSFIWQHPFFQNKPFSLNNMTTVWALRSFYNKSIFKKVFELSSNIIDKIMY